MSPEVRSGIERGLLSSWVPVRRIKLRLTPLLKPLKGILKGFFNPAQGWTVALLSRDGSTLGCHARRSPRKWLHQSPACPSVFRRPSVSWAAQCRRICPRPRASGLWKAAKRNGPRRSRNAHCQTRRQPGNPRKSGIRPALAVAMIHLPQRRVILIPCRVHCAQPPVCLFSAGARAVWLRPRQWAAGELTRTEEAASLGTPFAKQLGVKDVVATGTARTGLGSFWR